MKGKLTKWDIQDHLKTTEDRAFYLEAAIDEAIEYNDPGFLAAALGDVATSLKGKSIALFMSGVAAGLATLQPLPAAKASRRKTTKRGLVSV